MVSADLLPGSLYALKVAAVFAGVLAIVRVFVRTHHPFPTFGPANQVTTVRAALVALVAGLIGEAHLPAYATARPIVSGIVTALDGVDGWLARRTRMASAFGARFDMEVDALLILVLSILAWQYEKAGPWIVLAGLLRYVFVAAGWVFPWMARPLLAQPAASGRLRHADCRVEHRHAAGGRSAGERLDRCGAVGRVVGLLSG